MAITKITDDLNVIQKLDNEPNDVGGLKPEELKVKFDESGNKIKDYINNTLLEEIDEKLATKEELNGVVLGEIPDKSLTLKKFTDEAFESLPNKQHLADLFTNGIIANALNELKVTQTDTLSKAVKVDTGKVNLGATVYTYDTPTTLTIESSDALDVANEPHTTDGSGVLTTTYKPLTQQSDVTIIKVSDGSTVNITAYNPTTGEITTDVNNESVQVNYKSYSKRIDVVYIDTDGTLKVLKGTPILPAFEPVAPTLQTGQFKLAEISINPNYTNITNTDITKSNIFASATGLGGIEADAYKYLLFNNEMTEAEKNAIDVDTLNKIKKSSAYDIGKLDKFVGFDGYRSYNLYSDYEMKSLSFNFNNNFNLADKNYNLYSSSRHIAQVYKLGANIDTVFGFDFYLFDYTWQHNDAYYLDCSIFDDNNNTRIGDSVKLYYTSLKIGWNSVRFPTPINVAGKTFRIQIGAGYNSSNSPHLCYSAYENKPTYLGDVKTGSGATSLANASSSSVIAHRIYANTNRVLGSAVLNIPAKDIDKVSSIDYTQIIPDNSTNNVYVLDRKTPLYTVQTFSDGKILYSSYDPYQPIRFFNENLTSVYMNSDSDEYVGYTFDDGAIIDSVMVYLHSTSYGWKTYKIQASNDKTNWVNLLEKHDLTGSDWHNGYNIINFPNTEKYKYYRVYVDESLYTNRTYFSILSFNRLLNKNGINYSEAFSDINKISVLIEMSRDNSNIDSPIVEDFVVAYKDKKATVYKLDDVITKDNFNNIVSYHNEYTTTSVNYTTIELNNISGILLNCVIAGYNFDDINVILDGVTHKFPKITYTPSSSGNMQICMLPAMSFNNSIEIKLDRLSGIQRVGVYANILVSEEVV